MAMNHDEMRLTVCCSCQKPGSKRKLTPQLLDAAKAFLFDGFDIDDPKPSIGLCNSCRGKLMRNTDPKTNPTYNKWIADSRFDKDPCKCYICFFGRSKKHIQGKPKEKPTDSTITICKTCFQSVSPGPPHNCLLSNRVSNLLLLIPSGVIQQLASHTILHKYDPNNNSEGKPVKLVQERGPRLRVYLHKRYESAILFFKLVMWNLTSSKSS